nr:integrase core domain-containing protein [Flaviflexus equikiangi]
MHATIARRSPYRPQTNGKVERSNRTLAQEWAYAIAYDSDQARTATYHTWLHHYNHHRPHTGIGGQGRLPQTAFTTSLGTTPSRPRPVRPVGAAHWSAGSTGSPAPEEGRDPRSAGHSESILEPLNRGRGVGDSAADVPVEAVDLDLSTAAEPVLGRKDG